MSLAHSKNGLNLNDNKVIKPEWNHSILIAGEREVGKTTIRKICFENRSYNNYIPTKMNESTYLDLERYNDRVHLTIWEIIDFLQPKKKTLDLIKKSNSLILIIDMANFNTFNKYEQYLENFLEHKQHKHFSIAILYHKSDLVDKATKKDRKENFNSVLPKFQDNERGTIIEYETSKWDEKNIKELMREFMNLSLEIINKNTGNQSTFFEDLSNTTNNLS